MQIGRCAWNHVQSMCTWPYNWTYMKIKCIQTLTHACLLRFFDTSSFLPLSFPPSFSSLLPFCVHAHTHWSTHLHKHVYECTHSHPWVCIHSFSHTHTHTHTHAFSYLFKQTLCHTLIHTHTHSLSHSLQDTHTLRCIPLNIIFHGTHCINNTDDKTIFHSTIHHHHYYMYTRIFNSTLVLYMNNDVNKNLVAIAFTLARSALSLSLSLSLPPSLPPSFPLSLSLSLLSHSLTHYLTQTGTHSLSVKLCKEMTCKMVNPCMYCTFSFECNCTDTGFSGANCTDNIDDCLPGICQHNGTCVDGIKVCGLCLLLARVQVVRDVREFWHSAHWL